jgi:hypothetical protein
MRANIDQTAFILNDQLGRGRSSTTAVMLLLIQRWLRRGRESAAPHTPSRDRSRPGMPRKMTAISPAGGTSLHRTSWQIINSCLRVIRNGTGVKRVRADPLGTASDRYTSLEYADA